MGMRQVIFGAPGLELVSAALFLAADGVAVCRPHIAGVATGAVTGACQPHWSIWNPAAAGFAALVNSATPTAGIALAAIAAGALVQYGPVPLRLVYALILADFVALTLALLAIPEPGARTGSTPYLK